MFVKFNSIGDLGKAIKHVKSHEKYHGVSLGTLTYVGTEKLHGTNAGVYISPEVYSPQGRNKALTIENDNFGFASYMLTPSRKDVFLAEMRKVYGEDAEIVVYGEYVGKGIQKKVAISELDKHFVIFKVLNVKEEKFVPLPTDFEALNSVGIWVITQVRTFEIDINFDNWQLASVKLNEWLNEVEPRSPWGVLHGVEGIGEGMVFTPLDDRYAHDTAFWFKVKGGEHKNVDKARKNLKPVDAERYARLLDLIAIILPDWRLEQGLSELKQEGHEIIRENTSKYIPWVIKDTLKEQSDAILESEFETKEVTGKIAQIASKYYLEACNNQLLEDIK